MREGWKRPFPFALTLEGQYIIKNLVLIAAGIVLGGQITHRLRGATRAAPDAFHSLLRQGRSGTARPGEVLVREGERLSKIFFLRSGGGVVRVGEREVGRIGVPNFTITAKPTLFAAGDDVITESIEHMTFRGRAATLHGLDVKHFERGRVTREWQYANSAGSLGALFGITLEVP